MNQADKVKLIPHIDYVEKELSFLPAYEREIDWKTYYSLRSKRLEIERWIECLINAALDISKMFLMIKGETVPETSREVLFQMGSRIYGIEAEAEGFSELAKIRNTLAHRYLDIRWRDIRRFLQAAPKLYPAFIYYVKKAMEGDKESDD